MMADDNDDLEGETPEETLEQILIQGSPTIRERVLNLIESGKDPSIYCALVSQGAEDTKNRFFTMRFIEREKYADHIRERFPDIAADVLDDVSEEEFRLVILFDGMIAVRDIIIEDDGPVLNARGGSA